MEVDGGKERGGWDDKRPFFVSLVDPFNLQGLVRERRERRKERDAVEGVDGKEGGVNEVDGKKEGEERKEGTDGKTSV